VRGGRTKKAEMCVVRGAKATPVHDNIVHTHYECSEGETSTRWEIAISDSSEVVR